MRNVITTLALLLATGCGGFKDALRETRTAAQFQALDPADFFTPVGDFVPGRFTMVYVPIALTDKSGEPLAEPPPLERFSRLADADP